MKIKTQDVSIRRAGTSEKVVYVSVCCDRVTEANRGEIYQTLINMGYEFNEFIVEFWNPTTGEVVRKFRSTILAASDAADYPPKGCQYVRYYFPGMAPKYTNVKITYLDT